MRAPDKIPLVFSYVDECKGKVTITELSKKFGIAYHYLVRLCNGNLKNRIYISRINHSKILLLAGKSCKWAAFESGFKSVSQFNRTFKKITGESPSKFLENIPCIPS